MAEHDITVQTQGENRAVGFSSAEGFELMQRQAKVLASSDLVPKEFKGNIANCIIGLEVASRIGASPLAVLQNLYIVHGKPGWSSQFIIAAVNSTGKFSPLRFEMSGEGDKRTCTAWAIDLSAGDRLESPQVSIAMAKSEGWVEKAGSKWKTMPELMLRYRAATFFGRLYAPEILMGMQTMEEVEDVATSQPVRQQRGASTINRVSEAIAELPAPATVCELCQEALLNGKCHNPKCDNGEPPPEA